LERCEPAEAIVTNCVVPAEEMNCGEVHPFEIVFICTANRARSPFAAELMRRHVAGLQVDVRSFGASQGSGAPVLRGALTAARSFGIDLTGHRARRLPAGGLAASDLVIGFEYLHITTAVIDGGAPRNRTFLIGELAEALTSLPLAPGGNEGPRELVALADECRKRAAIRGAPIPDPAGFSDRRFLATFDQIDRLTGFIVVRLFGARSDWTS
jgi:protein-tyrosine-phosphatase